MFTGKFSSPSKAIPGAMAAFVSMAMLLAGSARAHDTVYYYSSDALHSEVVITDANRNVVERTYYSPYGQVLNRSMRDGPGYTGHEEDPETSLVYMQQRYYDPQSGRFLSTDPVQATVEGGNFNRYWYANDNPYRYTDPNGEATYNEFDNGITIVVQKFKNNGTQFSDTQIMQQGANLSGTTSKGQVMIVLLVPGSGKDTVQINANPKLNDMNSNGNLRSHTDKIGGRDVEIAPNAQGPGTVGHELGHVLDAGDQYKGGVSATGKPVTSDVPGPVNIMKNAVGNANTQTVNEISRGATSPQNTRRSCHTTMNGKDSATVCQ